MARIRSRRPAPGRALALVLTLALAAPARAQHDAAWWSGYIAAPDEVVTGRTRGEHAADWWRWSMNIEKETSPMRDATGIHCAVGQKGDVWYLGGVYGGGRVRRTCAIPAGKAIFFPLITMMFHTPPGVTARCADKQADAAVNNDRMAYLEVTLDGTPVPHPERYRARSPGCFGVFEGWRAREVGSDGAPAATDGYWIMLKPLPPGDYLLTFRSAYNRPDEFLGAMTQDVEYRLTVQPR